MATITTTLTLDIATETFATGLNLEQIERSAVPFMEVVCSGSVEIPAVIATNDGQFVATANLPVNYVYRFEEIRLMMNGTSAADLADEKVLATVEVQEHGALEKSFFLCNQLPTALGNSNQATNTAIPAVTNDFSTSWIPILGDRIYSDIIDGSRDVPVVSITVINADNAGTTTAIDAIVYMRFLAFTIAQFNHAALWMESSKIP